MKNTLIYFLGACLLSFCINKNDKAFNLHGVYVFSSSPQDSIIIENGSTYRHVYWTSRNEKYETVGKWIYGQKNEEILFKNYSFFNDKGSSTASGNWYSRVRISSNGQIDLMYSRENNIFYRKMLYEE